MSALDQIKPELAQAIRLGDSEKAVELAQRGLDEGVDPHMIFDECVVPTLKEAGDRFGRLEIFLPELMMNADAAKAVINLLEPVIKAQASGAISTRGKVVIGTATGDIHDIGKTMVATMMEVSGFEVIDLGVDVPVKEFLATARAQNADIIAMSSLLTTSQAYIIDLINILKETGESEGFKVMVGGGPITAEWAHKIGADGYGKDAAEAVNVAIDLCGRLQPEKML